MIKFIFVATSKNSKAYREDPSFIYRCENLAYGIQKHGYMAKTVHISELLSNMDGDIYIFHRPKFSLRFVWLIEVLKIKRKVLIADIDDLIFDPKEARYSPAYINGIMSLRRVKKNFFLHRLALRFFSYFSVSTQPLKDRLQHLFKDAKTIVVSNSIHYSWLNQPLPSKNSEKIIGYFPGTKSHDRDFAYVAEGLQDFLLKHPEIYLHVTGKIDFQIKAHPNQVVYKQKVSFDKHHSNYQNIWVNIAPLENTPFNACKSALKVIEAGFFNIPTVTMPNDDNERFNGSGALIAEDVDAFIKHLETLTDPAVFSLHSDGLRGKIEKKAHISNEASKFIRFCEDSFPLLFAVSRRNHGEYNKKTLKLFIRACLKDRSYGSYVAFASFCRDLGSALSKARFRRLNQPIVKYLFFQKTHRLLCEFKKVNPFFSKTMRAIYQNQEQWQNAFEAKIKSGTICIVGNGTNLTHKKLGASIDTYDTVIRFNRCLRVPDEDVGSKTDVWVSAPDLTYAMQARWIVLSGPNVLYSGANWKRFYGLQLDSQYLISVPLHIWKELVSMLQAPPSAGILMVYWIYQIVGSFSAMTIAGFDLDAEKRHEHYHEPHHIPSDRHNWQKEKAFLKEWIGKGLRNLEEVA